MKISENWLRSWVNPAVDSDVLAHQLTMAGLEVDDSSTVAKPFTGVVVGEVLTVEQHPDADRLRVTTVNIGSGEPLQIVCGAPNVAVGLKVPVATIGAILPGDFKIKKGKLRGVESHGMLCGASEIDLEDSIDGLLVLPQDAPIGTDIRDYLKLDDRIIEISITPNRGDCFSIKGIARELGVINNLAVTPVDIQPVAASIADKKSIQLHSAGCPRYAGRVIKNINAQATTPQWMADALSRSGIRVHSVLVDITNYVLLEQGQPLHAFDLNKIEGDIQVRQARPQEKLTLLNEQDIELGDDVLVISDDTKVLAMAGIMGGLHSSVTDATTDIFLESAFFDPLAIAGRARRYGMHTDASQRYERGVDFELAMPAIERATQLILQLAGGEAGEVVLVEQPEALPKRLPIDLTLTQINQLLGYEVAADFVEQTLSRLGMQISTQGAGWLVVPPSYRFDIAIKEDLIEEVARIYGYDNIQTKMPVLEIDLKPAKDRLSIQQLRQTLVSLGYQEAISFSFADEKLEKQLNPDVKLLTLANPISSELGVMRSTLLSSLIPSVQYNLNRQQSRVRLFETGLRFDYENATGIQDLKQIPTLALIATGTAIPEQWHAKAQPMDFYDLKGEVERILTCARLQAHFEPSARAWLHPGQSTNIVVQGQVIGYLGRLHPSLEDQLDLGKTWVCEMDLDVLLQPYVSNFTELSRFPTVRRDIAILISANITIDQIQHTIQSAAGEWLIQSWLFDVYTGQGIEAGQRSLAFALLWQHPERTLEDAEIKEGMQRVIDALQDTYKATLRAS
ncbi:phenylalanine--tRNA ligase subunit beta [Alkanindiges hydrocarboniclasticus]|uniref:Phenylalanine--tRNA ligase beta subunit n=1 Tax=Alkanindiges hydrocarboniclasticus TaxID=1907941 RepID=A0A1S8CXR6_9GAMM|nr:phenylalanine--tRNA ligase subunit beta [Alkanindiges hydrocarboniclasticus]ONG41989.1 phenylalanine--tRNA ligase subunit beta [Alkanindiges hydrocarboniclasticus]